MDAETRYLLTKWRKRLERRGWHNARRFPLPRAGWVEYHAVWQGWLVSGRCSVVGIDEGYWEPGSPCYLLHRGQDVIEAVWRPTTVQRQGRIVRPLAVVLASVGR